jgi:short-subunit dehydrogenase
MLPMNPIPEYFALSLVKAAQRNLMQSLWMVYAKQGVHVGVVNVGGPVSEGHEVWNPRNVAERAWGWFEEGKGEFEVLV